ncbi:MAG TPA: biosynthetic-type acetolactate synthase large subunit [Nitrospinota bacterium]|nr:biosynthetic-type acetolactate synthase large subunit [Nitrospinota bacterium]
MAKMLVTDAIVKILEDEGIEVAFGIPGAAINPLYKSLSQSKKIRHFISRHEEGACHSADGYARVADKVGLCLATSGPGATNFVTGLYTAKVDSIPIVAITGQNVRALLGKEAFQAVDIAEIVKPITKKSYCITEASRVPVLFREAFRIAREGRPGPVLIDLPMDLQREEIEYDPDADHPLEFSKPGPRMKSIEKTIDMILEAKAPIILAGGGVVIANATKEFLEFAEYMSIPVVTTYQAKGGIPADHPYYAGNVGIQINTLLGNKTFLESDLVLGIGCRFVDRHTGDLSVYTKGRKFIHVDIDPNQIGKIVPVELGIVSDAKLALEAMLKTAKEKTPQRPPNGRVKDIALLKKEMARKMDYDDIPIKPPRVYKEINEFFDKDTIFTSGCGLNQIWSGQFQDVYKPRRYIMCGCAGTLGFDIPAAIGAKLASPESTAVAVMGDGGFGFLCSELAVASQYDIPIIVVVINNGYLSLIRQHQKYALDFEYQVDLRYKEHLIDIVKVSEGFGCYAERVNKPDEIKNAFQRAVDSGRPSVIDIMVERTADAAMGLSIDAIKEFEPIPAKPKQNV